MDIEITIPTVGMSPAEEATLASLETSLQAAIEDRAKVYTETIAFSMRYEADDTSSEKDAQNFRQFCQLLSLPNPEEIVFKKDVSAGFIDAMQFAADLTRRICNCSGRVLVIGHYAGHGELGHNDQLWFSANTVNPQKINFERLFSHFWEHDDFQKGDSNYLQNLDMCMILDCCQAGTITRGSSKVQRTVEFVTAVRSGQSALGNPTIVVKNKTFTSRLVDALAKYIGTGANSVTMSDLVDTLRLESKTKDKRTPEYAIKLGSRRIVFPIKVAPHLQGLPQIPSRRMQSSSLSSQAVSDSSSLPPTPSNTDPIYRAVFSVHIEDVGGAPAETARWINNLDPQYDINLLAVYRSRSVTFLFESPWRVWTALDGLPGYTLVVESFGGNQLDALIKMVTIQDSPSPGNSRKGKENEPFQKPLAIRKA